MEKQLEPVKVKVSPIHIPEKYIKDIPANVDADMMHNIVTTFHLIVKWAEVGSNPESTICIPNEEIEKVGLTVSTFKDCVYIINKILYKTIEEKLFEIANDTVEYRREMVRIDQGTIGGTDKAIEDQTLQNLFGVLNSMEKTHTVLYDYYLPFAPMDMVMFELKRIQNELQQLAKEKKGSKSIPAEPQEYRFPFSMPGLKWEEVTLKFTSGADVSIEARGERIKCNYTEMGMKDKKTTIGNLQWQLLQKIAEAGGTITDAMLKTDIYLRLNLKKRKQLLSKALQTYFGIEEDAFYPYRKEKIYRLKMQLVPEK
jgi:hypothetical protein